MEDIDGGAHELWHPVGMAEGHDALRVSLEAAADQSVLPPSSTYMHTLIIRDCLLT